jgi:proline utilization trans-activator
MVNIAFPFKEADSIAMGQALQVLQSMASKGNSYMRACHSLLSKIKGNIKQRSAPNNIQLRDIGSGQRAGNDVPESDLPRPSSPLRGQEETLDQTISISDQPFIFDMDEDPTLWNEVLDSIGIDMDRHWMENALLSGQGTEAFT